MKAEARRVSYLRIPTTSHIQNRIFFFPKLVGSGFTLPGIDVEVVIVFDVIVKLLIFLWLLKQEKKLITGVFLLSFISSVVHQIQWRLNCTIMSDLFR